MSGEIPKSLKRWEVTRQKGKTRFILQNGILGWGLPMFFFMTFFFGRQQNRPLTVNWILISACIWALAGAAFGWLVWIASERKYRKFTSAPQQG